MNWAIAIILYSWVSMFLIWASCIVIAFLLLYKYVLKKELVYFSRLIKISFYALIVGTSMYLSILILIYFLEKLWK